jgi:sugar lactone lactonase YvrE
MKSWTFEEPVVAIALTSKAGTLLLALASRLMLWTPDADRRVPLEFTLAGSPLVRLNDGRADPRGDFWVGSMQNNVLPNGDLDLTVEGHWARPGHGKLFRVTGNGTHSIEESDIGISNTLCWSPDKRTFYFGDTLRNEISAYDYDIESGRISNRRPFFSGFARGGPDGSAIDTEGFVWSCRFGGGCIVRVAPDGTIDRIIEMPCTDVTTCTFGGDDMKRLFVTTAAMRHHPGERLAGSLFAIDTDVPGLPENVFRI